MSTKTLKTAAIVCFIVAMGGLLLGGLFANREAPPYPGRVTAPNGSVLFTKADILAGQDVYQRYGLMDHGSVWGHGSQRGMEFSAIDIAPNWREGAGEHFEFRSRPPIWPAQLQKNATSLMSGLSA